MELSNYIASFMGISRAHAHHRITQMTAKQPLVLAALDHLDDSPCDWFVELGFGLRYDLWGNVVGITMASYANTTINAQPIQKLKRQSLIEYYQQQHSPLERLGQLLLSVREGLSFYFEGQTLMRIDVAKI